MASKSNASFSARSSFILNKSSNRSFSEYSNNTNDRRGTDLLRKSVAAANLMLGAEDKKTAQKQYNEFNPGLFLNLSQGRICEEDSDEVDTSIDEEATGTLNSSMHKEMLLHRDTIK